MIRFIPFAFAVHCLCASAAIGEVYLLRLDTRGYVDRPAAEKNPQETVLRSITVLARPDAAFHGEVRIGTEQTLTLTGKLSPADDGGFSAQIKYVHSIDTGITVPTQGGQRKPLPSTTTFHTTATVALGRPVTIGGSDVETTRLGKPKNQSKSRYVLRLDEYEPPDD